MNTKSYINYFPEIASLDVNEQESVLEQARYCAFTRLGLAGESAWYFIISTLAGLCLPAVAFVVFVGYSIVINSIAVGLGCGLTTVVHKKLYASLLQLGLKEVLRAG